MWGLYSVGLVQCGACTVWGLYSVGLVQYTLAVLCIGAKLAHTAMYTHMYTCMISTVCMIRSELFLSHEYTCRHSLMMNTKTYHTMLKVQMNTAYAYHEAVMGCWVHTLEMSKTISSQIRSTIHTYIQYVSSYGT